MKLCRKDKNLGHSLPAHCDGCPILAQSFEVVAQVLAVGVVRDRHGKKTSGLELAAEAFGQAGHFYRIATGLFPLVKLLVASSNPVDLGLVTS